MTNVGWYEPPDNYSANCLVKRQYIFDDECITHKFLWHNRLDLEIVYQSKNVLFPKENVDIGEKIKWAYKDRIPLTLEEQAKQAQMYGPTSNEKWYEWAKGKELSLVWTLYADNMHRKSGEVQICELPLP